MEYATKEANIWSKFNVDPSHTWKEIDWVGMIPSTDGWTDKRMDKVKPIMPRSPPYPHNHRHRKSGAIIVKLGISIYVSLYDMPVSIKHFHLEAYIWQVSSKMCFVGDYNIKLHFCIFISSSHLQNPLQSAHSPIVFQVLLESYW